MGNASSLAGQYSCPHTDYFYNHMTGHQHRVNRQNSPAKEEAFQLLDGRSYAPMRHLSLLPIAHPYD